MSMYKLYFLSNPYFKVFLSILRPFFLFVFFFCLLQFGLEINLLRWKKEKNVKIYNLIILELPILDSCTLFQQNPILRAKTNAPFDILIKKTKCKQVFCLENLILRVLQHVSLLLFVFFFFNTFFSVFYSFFSAEAL